MPNPAWVGRLNSNVFVGAHHHDSLGSYRLRCKRTKRAPRKERCFISETPLCNKRGLIFPLRGHHRKGACFSPACPSEQSVRCPRQSLPTARDSRTKQCCCALPTSCAPCHEPGRSPPRRSSRRASVGRHPPHDVAAAPHRYACRDRDYVRANARPTRLPPPCHDCAG